ncbi:hypothetical protein COBT_002162, partial [Conglomerata obtusa]
MKFIVISLSYLLSGVKLRIYKHEDIYADLVTLQNQNILEEAPCLQKHQHTTFLIFIFDNQLSEEKRVVQDAINKVYSQYKEINNIDGFKFIASYQRNLEKLHIGNCLLKFLQNSYIVNTWVKNEEKTLDNILEQHEFHVENEGIHDDWLKRAFQKNDLLLKDKNFLNDKEFQALNFILIANCLDVPNDYGLLYSEAVECNKISFGFTSKKNCLTNIILMALKFTNDDTKLILDKNLIVEAFNQNLIKAYKIDIEILNMIKRKPSYNMNYQEISNYIIGDYIHIDPKTFKFDMLPIKINDKNLNFGTTVHSIYHDLSQDICEGKEIESNHVKYLHDGAKLLRQYSITIRNWFSDFIIKIFVFEKFYKEKNLNDINCVEYIVYVFCGNLNFSILFTTFSYFINLKTLIVSLGHQYKGIKDAIEHKANNEKIGNLIETTKKILSLSFLEYNYDLALYYFIMKENHYVNFDPDIKSVLFYIKWDHNNFLKSFSNFLNSLYQKLEDNVYFSLYEYRLNTELFYEQITQQNEIKLFACLENLQFLQVLNKGFVIDNSGEDTKLLIQICDQKINYKKYYYIFLPIYEFNIVKFSEFYNNNIQSLYYIFINDQQTRIPNILCSLLGEISQELFKDIKFKTIFALCFHSKKYFDYIDALVNNIIAQKTKNKLFLYPIYNKMCKDDFDVFITTEISYIKKFYNEYDEFKHKMDESLACISCMCLHQLFIDEIRQFFLFVGFNYVQTFMNNDRQLCYIQFGSQYDL